MASSRSEEMLTLGISQHKMVSQCWCVLQFVGLYYFIVVADVMATIVWHCDVFLADVIALLPYDCNFLFLLG